MSWLQRTLSTAALFGALAFTACSPYGALCADQADCEGGNDADIDACEIASNASEDVADAYDCGDQWADYVDCIAERSRCSNNKFGPSDDCNSEADRANDCINKRR